MKRKEEKRFRLAAVVPYMSYAMDKTYWQRSFHSKRNMQLKQVVFQCLPLVKLREG